MHILKLISVVQQALAVALDDHHDNQKMHAIAGFLEAVIAGTT